MQKRTAAVRAAELIAANATDVGAGAGAGATLASSSGASSASVVGRFGDGTASQSVTPSKVAAAAAAGLLTRGTAARVNPHLYTEGVAIRRSDGSFKCPSAPDWFRPNVSPSEVLQAGAFGGYYFRPLASGVTGRVLVDQHHELPITWLVGVSQARFLTALHRDPKVNKFGVNCGQGEG